MRFQLAPYGHEPRVHHPMVSGALDVSSSTKVIQVRAQDLALQIDSELCAKSVVVKLCLVHLYGDCHIVAGSDLPTD